MAFHLSNKRRWEDEDEDEDKEREREKEELKKEILRHCMLTIYGMTDTDSSIQIILSHKVHLSLIKFLRYTFLFSFFLLFLKLSFSFPRFANY